MRNATRSSEDLIKLIEHVSYKKTEGRLYLMDHRLAWMTNTSETFKISEPYQNIRAQRISPANKDKVQLQLLMHTNASYTFHFIHPEGKDAQISSRDEVKNLLQKLLPKFRDKAHAELEKKKNICLNNPQVSDLYKELVANKYLSKEEFWNKIEDDIKQNNDAEVSQVKAIPTWFLTSKNDKVQLSEAMIEDIFSVYPSVKDKYIECVPTKMSKEEFWKQFYQSHYYHRMRTENASDIFSSCIEKDRNLIIQEANKIKSSVINSTINTNIDDDDICKEPINNTNTNIRTEYNIESEVLHRFNRHYFFLLRQITENKRKSSTDIDKEVDSKKLKRNDEFYEEEKVLERIDDSVDGVDFNTQNVKNYMQKISGKMVGKAQQIMNPLRIKERQMRLHQIKKNIETRVPFHLNPQWAAHSSTTAADVLTHIGYCLSSSASNDNTITTNTDNQDSSEPNKTNSKSKSLPPDLIPQLTKIYMECFELTKHYWLCFPVTNSEKYNRLCRMAESVKKFGQNRIKQFKQTHSHAIQIATRSSNSRSRNNESEFNNNRDSLKLDPIDHLFSMVDKVGKSFENFKRSHQIAGSELQKYTAAR